MRNKRYEYVLMRTAEMMNKGEIVFSPIVHCHEMAIKHDLPKTYEFWSKYDREMINRADEVWVLCMPGYKESRGITDELKMAEELGTIELLRSDFINNFSHEFKTPIVSIKGFVEILKYSDLTYEEQQEYLDIINGNRISFTFSAG